MASTHYDFELRANLFNDIKVDENFCPYSVITSLFYVFCIYKVGLNETVNNRLSCMIKAISLNAYIGLIKVDRVYSINLGPNIKTNLIRH